MIKSGLSYLKDEIKEMSEDEIKIEKPIEIVNTVEKIPEFNRNNPKGQRLKALTADQMLKRLSISLDQLKVRNNSKNLKKK